MLIQTAVAVYFTNELLVVFKKQPYKAFFFNLWHCDRLSVYNGEDKDKTR